ncbi:hypothetical protein, conserved [Trypanosoma brucei brucei TREU927]|uniref:Uncharacterized protein n=1 Tax=Trypanosoma brucei brucei (strain 927/4 GUTat10.1) TaxID=185431 RepID=Q584A1_TRYB2|nr:hypothetical protein, conserved [Trypanosoma brucei brucei TREU927]AAX79816.1 hypothetical protein, conserved [Trypanosoma brucei]AAZ10915.1 hypothetical protein, conserved [Trypanosoma brucei brucei TREU927]
MIKISQVTVTVVFFVLPYAGRTQVSYREPCFTLKRIDCVVKKLNWMINVTEDLLLRTRVHAEEVYGKKYSLEERFTTWKELYVYVKNFVRKEKGDKMKEILNEMESVFEGESYLRKKFNLNVSYLEEKVMDVVRTGTRYAATMVEMYRVGLEAVCIVNKSHGYCGDNGAYVKCGTTFVGKDISDVVRVLENSSEHIDLSFQNRKTQKVAQSGHGGSKLADKVNAASTSYGHIIKHRGIRSNLGKSKVITNGNGLVEFVHSPRIFKSFITPLREINDIISEIEATPSKLLEQTSRIDALEKELQSIFSSITISTA